jgi:hypothetical protein
MTEKSNDSFSLSPHFMHYGMSPSYLLRSFKTTPDGVRAAWLPGVFEQDILSKEVFLEAFVHFSAPHTLQLRT